MRGFRRVSGFFFYYYAREKKTVCVVCVERAETNPAKPRKTPQPLSPWSEGGGVAGVCGGDRGPPVAGQPWRPRPPGAAQPQGEAVASRPAAGNTLHFQPAMKQDTILQAVK